MASHRDSSSAANTDRFVVKHVHLDLHGDPAKRRLEGRVTLRTLCVRPAGELVLDVHPSLEVRAVHEDLPGESDDVGRRRVSGEELSFEVRPFTGFGSALHIALREPPNTGQLLNVTVEYATGDGPGVRISSSDGELHLIGVLVITNDRARIGSDRIGSNESRYIIN